MKPSPEEARQAISLQTRYQDDPLAFFVERLDVKPEHIWHKMEEMVNAVRDNQRVAIKAGHSVSKTYTMGRLVLWFLYNFYPSTVITTAPSFPQVEQLLWREIRQAHSNAVMPLGGNLTKTQLDLQDQEGGDKWFAYGFATKPDSASINQEATRVQGFHNKHVLVIFDEANGVIKPIWDAVESLITSDLHKFVVIGNPTTPQGMFPECFNDSDYAKVTISCLDTPNYKEGKEVIPGLAGRSFVERIEKKYGKDSDRYRSRVLGEIPDNDIDSLIPMKWYEAAEKRQRVRDIIGKRLFLTVDIADGGDDATIIKKWYNKHELGEVVLREKKIEEVEPYIWRALKDIGGNTIIYDADGVGRVLGGYLEASCPEGVEIIPFSGGSRECDNLDDFCFRRDEGYWALRQDFERNLISLQPDNADQKEEVCCIKQDYDSAFAQRGYIKIEKKVDIKRRIGRSTDKADTLMMMSACFDLIKKVNKADPYAAEIESDYVWNPMTV